jgi:hypothetical protein
VSGQEERNSIRQIGIPVEVVCSGEEEYQLKDLCGSDENSAVNDQVHKGFEYRRGPNLEVSKLER